jgi:hypothetical protein
MSLIVSSPFARDAVRLLAGWVAFIVLVQAMAAALGLAQGPRHLHLPGAAQVHHDHRHHDPHDHHHDAWERHVHASPAPGAVLADEAQELGATAGAVLSAMVALGPWHPVVGAATAGHVMCAATAWTCSTHAAALPERPPRA